jgi:hypothetical protein
MFAVQVRAVLVIRLGKCKCTKITVVSSQTVCRGGWVGGHKPVDGRIGAQNRLENMDVGTGVLQHITHY